MQKIRKIAKTAMLLSVLGLLFHDFVPHHHHVENSNSTCTHHTEKQTNNDFSLEQTNDLDQHINHSSYSKFYKQILFNFTFVEVQKTGIPQIYEFKINKFTTFISLCFYKKNEAHSYSRRGPPTV